MVPVFERYNIVVITKGKGKGDIAYYDSDGVGDTICLYTVSKTLKKEVLIVKRKTSVLKLKNFNEYLKYYLRIKKGG